MFFRIRGFRGRDIAFITAGFAMLALAPIAEFMITSPDEKAGGLRQGFDQKGVDYGGPGSPFEDGIARIAPGNLLGQIAESISPLTARDPSSLILSPSEDEAPPDEEKPAESKTAPPPKKESGWKDAISSARRGAREAAKQVRLPVPSARLASRMSGLSGLSGGSGGSGSSLSLSAPVSRGLISSRTSAEDHLSRVQATSDYRGGGRRSGASGAGSLPGAYLDAKRVMSGGGLSSSSGGGHSGSGGMSDSGSSGAGSGGGMARGDHDPASTKGAGGGTSSTTDTRNISPKDKKESLAEMAKKMNMEQAIKLKWDKKRYDQIERKKMMEQIAMQTASQAFLKVLDKFLEEIFSAQGGAEGQKKKKKKSAEQAQQQDPGGMGGGG